MIRYSLLFLLLLAFFSPLQAQRKRDKLLIKILEAQVEEDYVKANQYLTELIKLEPDNATAYSLRGSNYKTLGQNELAIKDLNIAISLEPEYYCYYIRGCCYLDLHNSEKAILDYNQALELGVRDSAILKSIYIDRGTAKVKIRNFTGALDDYMYVYQLDSSDFSAVFGLSRTYLELENDSLTYAFLMKANQLRPNHPDIVNNIGFYYLNHEQYEEAAVYFKKSIVLGNDAFSWNNLGFCKYKTGDYYGALKDINRSIELMPENSYAWKNRALIYMALNNKSDACADLQKSLQLGFTTRYGSEVQELYDKHCK